MNKPILNLIKVLVLCCSTLGCMVQARYASYADNIKLQASLLKKYYEKAINSTGKQREKYEKLFFEAFPSSFINYFKLYQYPGPLYAEVDKDGYGHTQLFDDLKHISKEEYYNKYIDVYIGGWWDADALRDFGLYGKLLEDTKECSAIFLKRDRNELISAFFFMFDEPHPKSQEKSYSFKTLYDKVVEVSPDLAEIISSAYTLMLHHHRFYIDSLPIDDAMALDEHYKSLENVK